MKLRDEIDAAIDPDDGVFDPDKVLADPEALKGLVNRYLDYMKYRDRIDPYYRILLGVGPILLGCLTLGLVSIGLLLFQQTPLALDYEWLDSYSIRLGIAVGIIAAVVFFARLLVIHLITNAEVQSSRDESND